MVRRPQTEFSDGEEYEKAEDIPWCSWCSVRREVAASRELDTWQ